MTSLISTEKVHEATGLEGNYHDHSVFGDLAQPAKQAIRLITKKPPQVSLADGEGDDHVLQSFNKIPYHEVATRLMGLATKCVSASHDPAIGSETSLELINELTKQLSAALMTYETGHDEDTALEMLSKKISQVLEDGKLKQPKKKDAARPWILGILSSPQDADL